MASKPRTKTTDQQTTTPQLEALRKGQVRKKSSVDPSHILDKAIYQLWDTINDLDQIQPERVEQFKTGEVRFPSVRLNDDTIIDLFPSPDMDPMGRNAPRNQDHFCMVIEPTDLNQLKSQFQALGIEIQAGPGPRWGAHGNGTSLYVYDPDDNMVELRYY